MTSSVVRRLICACAIVAAPTAAFAQEAVFSGTVTDSTGAILRRVPVRVNPLRLAHPRFVRQALARLGTDSTGTMALVLCAPCPPWGWCRADSTGTATWD